MLAYSSIAQAGYTLMGVAAISTTDSGLGAAAVAYYMFAYVLTNILAFGCILVFTNATGSEEIADMAGLGRRNMPLALWMTLALLSLAGIPPAAGFVGKALLFVAAVDAGLVILAAIAVINSIIALYYYLVVVKVMFFDHGPYEDQHIPESPIYFGTLRATAFGVFLLGTFLIGPIFEWAQQGGINLFVPF
jgi:NADH-quinone oxidoreductase subunit N